MTLEFFKPPCSDRTYRAAFTNFYGPMPPTEFYHWERSGWEVFNEGVFIGWVRRRLAHDGHYSNQWEYRTVRDRYWQRREGLKNRQLATQLLVELGE